MTENFRPQNRHVPELHVMVGTVYQIRHKRSRG